MLSFINHPAAVHIPLAVGVLYPLAYVVTMWGIRQEWWPRKAWLMLGGLACIQIVSCGLAYWTGWNDRLFSSAEIENLQLHSEWATYFSVIWLVIVFTVPLAFKVRRWSKFFHFFLLILLLAQAFFAVLVGKAGGSLINYN